MQRREVFNSLLKPFSEKKVQEKPIRPPYFKDINLFYTNCIECLEKPCIEACEESIWKEYRFFRQNSAFRERFQHLMTYIC